MPKRLEDLMAEKKVGVVELARRARVSHPAISQILHGLQVPHLRTARRIARALGVGLDELVFPAEANVPPDAEPSQPADSDAPSQEVQAA